MKRILYRSILGIALTAPAALIAVAPPQISIEALFSQPQITRLSFSPDGRYLAGLQPWEKRMNLVVVDLQKMQKTQLTSMREQDISNYQWAGDDRLICSMDTDGEERPSLFALDADGRNPGPLDALRGMSPLARIVGDKETIVITARVDMPTRSDVYHYNLRTGKAKLHARNPGYFNGWMDGSEWLTDHAGVARYGFQFESGVYSLHYRANAKAQWEKVATFNDGEGRWFPLMFDGDNRTVYVASDIGRKTFAIYRYDTATQTMGELVYGDDTYDVTSVIFNEALNRVIGVGYDGERPTTVWLEKTFQGYQRALDRAFPDTLIDIARASADNSRLLVRSFSDREPGKYYLFDTKKGTIELLAAVRPELKSEHLASMHPFSFKARDGLRLHGYLTLPAGLDPKNLPTIIHPHGGPYGPRDSWGYNPEVQLYANRGFAVLQLNFRGSGGYGDWFERAGHRKWGLEMQDDITDAVRWVIAQGIADPKRIVISGASYGGYATMAGLVYTPELYCAGINYVGVTDIMMLVDNPGLGSHAARNGEWWRRTRIGDPYKDAERLKATSPVNFADQVRVPLLLGYGLNDPRVEIAHGSKLASKLKSAGKVEGRDFWFYTERYEGHGFRKEEKRIAFYKHVDEFLKTQVLGRTSAAEVPPGQVKPGEVRVLEMPAKSIE